MTSPAMYLRISSDPNDTQLGVDRQREDCVRLCADRGWGKPVEYRDNDISADVGKCRPDYERLLGDIKADKITAVVAWDLDRLHRQPIELEHFMILADSKGVALATVSGDVDLSTEQGRLVARMKGSVAAYEVEQIRKRLRRKHLQQAQKGVPWKSWKKCPPFGYTTEGTPDPAVAPLIKDAYAHILAGGSLGEVCRQLNAAGAYSRTWEYPKEANAQGRLVKVADSALAPVRRPWRACNMSRFLRAPHHAGLVCHQGQVLSDADGNPVKGNWEPIVDPDTWFTVQNILSAPERKPTPKTVRRHLLTGLLRCGKCEGRMRGWKGKAAKAGRYYCTECFGVTIMADLVESLILGDIADRLAAPDAVELLKVEDTDAGEAAAARAERAVLTARLDEIALERADGLLDSRAFHLMSERITNRLDTLTGREYAHSNVRALADLPLGSAKIAKAIEACSLSRQRAILEALCSRIVVAPVGRRGANRFDPDRVQIEWQS